MHKCVIADTSVLIVLEKVQELSLLKELYQSIIITPEVKEEFGKSLPGWVKVEAVRDEKYLKFLSAYLDIGEASVIALSEEKEDPLLILDDLKARKNALRIGVPFTGTLGVLQKAKDLGLIKVIKPQIQKIEKAGFRISPKIIHELLKRNNEL